MKEKDLIKLVLLEKTFGYEGVKNKVRSIEEQPVQVVKKPKRRHLALAVDVCVLLLTVSAISIHLVFSSYQKTALPDSGAVSGTAAAGAEQCTETNSTDTPSQAVPERKVVYGPADQIITTDDGLLYGSFEIHPNLTDAMNNPDNADALFAVGVIYRCDKIWNGDENDPDYIAFMNAKEYFDACCTEEYAAENALTHFVKIDLPEKIDFSTIPEDIDEQLYKKHVEEQKKLNEIKDNYEGGIFLYSELVRYFKEKINAAQADEQTRSEALAELEAYWVRMKNALDNSKAAQDKYFQLKDERYAKFCDAYFERHGLDYNAIINQYGKLLLTKDEIISLTVNDDERVILYLLPETPRTSYTEEIVED